MLQFNKMRLRIIKVLGYKFIYCHSRSELKALNTKAV